MMEHGLMEYSHQLRLSLLITITLSNGGMKQIPKNNKDNLQKKNRLITTKNQLTRNQTPNHPPRPPQAPAKTYTAKDIAAKMILGNVMDDKKEQKKKLDESDQFKLIQFHPAYSYEDFVRGDRRQKPKMVR